MANNNETEKLEQFARNICKEKNIDFDKDFIIDYLDERYERVPTYNLSVGEVSAKYNDNVILITMTGHIVCSKYGVIYDSFDCRERQAEYCWIVK